MADDGFTGAGSGEPLAAPIAEQLRAKAELEEAIASARAHDERAHERVERGKEEERRAVAEHLAPFGAETPEGWQAQRAAARRSGGGTRARRGAGYGLTPVWAALAVLVLPRGLRWTVGLPIVLMLLLRDAPAR